MRLSALTSSLLFLLLPATGTYADSGSGLYPPGLQPLITRANVLLSTGQFNEAAKVYSEAIEQSPADYLLFYKRATAYLSLGRHAAALDDFAHVLTLTPLPSAHLMQARIHTKDGDFALARAALKQYAGGEKELAERDALLADIADAEAASKQAAQERAALLWTACGESATRALRTSTHSTSVRSLRVECALGAGDIEGAPPNISPPRGTDTRDTRPHLPPLLLPPACLPQSPPTLSNNVSTPTLSPGSASPLHRLSKTLERGFTMADEQGQAGDWRGALATLKGTGKKGDIFRKFEEAAGEQLAPGHLTLFGLDKAGQIVLPAVGKVSPRRRTLLRGLCKGHTNLEMYRKGEEWCRMLYEMEGGEEDADALRGLGEAALVKEEWEEGVRLLEKAFEATGRSDREFQARLQKAQRLLKQSRAKDYYKVLGVARDADERTIKKAYRKAAKTAHPDKGGSEQKMAALNEAYEVISNPGTYAFPSSPSFSTLQLRQRFDNGDDPNDPSGGHPFQQGGHPFAQFFQQQGGGFPGGRLPWRRRRLPVPLQPWALGLLGVGLGLDLGGGAHVLRGGTNDRVLE
ncbi:hypothetical protein MVEN_02408600 [Mycena venus]|uniref:J domain-containing protein n=1 Tax=Mycena venus TaxID=2733690 RepID=A0A8H6X2B7_9AGAR|nr:hypothetical protein MVEN_02408600 [Mycena venus]